MLVFATIGTCFPLVRAAASTCTGLPASTLRAYDIKASKLEQFLVPTEALNRIAPADELVSRHTMMFTAIDVMTLFVIRHRVVPQADGSVCDAPSLVTVGFGSDSRIAYLAKAAAADECVHKKMLAHEDDHARLFNEIVDHFIDQQKLNLERGMVALKQTSAPSADVAKARWEAGVRVIVAAAKQQLLDKLRAANAQVDNASTLAALAEACGGKIRQLEASSGL